MRLREGLEEKLWFERGCAKRGSERAVDARDVDEVDGWETVEDHLAEFADGKDFCWAGHIGGWTTGDVDAVML